MNKSEDIIKKIEALMVDKHFKDALKLIEVNSDDVSKKEYYYLKSVLRRYLNRTNEALICLDKLIQLDPSICTDMYLELTPRKLIS